MTTARPGRGRNPGRGWSPRRRCPPEGWRHLWTPESGQNRPNSLLPDTARRSRQLCWKTLPSKAGAQSGCGRQRPGNRAAGHKQGSTPPRTPSRAISPHPALPCWPGNPVLRRPVLTPGPAAVPGEGRRMQLPSGSQGLGETESVLKRQGGWLPCLGSLPGMTVPGSMVPLSLGFSHPRPGDRP